MLFCVMILVMARAYSLDLRERAVDYVMSGGRKSEACEIFKISHDTLWRWLRLHDETGDLRHKPLGSRPWKLDHSAIVDYVELHSDSTLAQIGAHFGTSASVVHYILRKAGITRKKNHAVSGAGRGKKTSISG